MRIEWGATDAGEGGPDQQAHLFGPYWATVGPRGDAVHGRWTWAVLDAADPTGGEVLAAGFAYNEADAKRAVTEWARPRAPRSLRRRLRSLRRRIVGPDRV